MPEPSGHTIRCGKPVPIDEVFLAWTSQNLPRMLRAMDLQTHPIDRHFLLMGIVDQTYKARKDPAKADTCHRVGRQHLAEFPQIAPVLKEDMRGRLPRVLTFQHLATLLAERGEFSEAIAVCESAIGYSLEDGTKGGYRGRIERIRKQQAKGKTPPPPAPSPPPIANGLTPYSDSSVFNEF